MSERLIAFLQYLLPKQVLTTLAGYFAKAQWGQITTIAIRRFAARYGVDLNEAANPDPASYITFNEFFTRPLKAGARPLADAAFVSPVDGAISQLGKINAGQIFQAKGHNYTVAALLGDTDKEAEKFATGDFATIYLSPKDYHRIHMPCAGKLLSMRHLPGDLFSVNPLTARNIPNLFARNERVVCRFAADFGEFVMVLVGATIVGSMATTWHGTVNPPRFSSTRDWNYADQDILLNQGEEMGRFLLGSTVILLFPPNTIAFHANWQATKKVRQGEAMASSIGGAAK